MAQFPYDTTPPGPDPELAAAKQKALHEPRDAALVDYYQHREQQQRELGRPLRPGDQVLASTDGGPGLMLVTILSPDEHRAQDERAGRARRAARETARADLTELVRQLEGERARLAREADALRVRLDAFGPLPADATDYLVDERAAIRAAWAKAVMHLERTTVSVANLKGELRDLKKDR